MSDLMDEAYEMLARILMKSARPNWLSLEANCPILGKGCGGITTTQEHAEGVSDIPVGMDVFALQETCLFLRELMLKTTGNRIWGVNFVLYPEGNFDAKYEYEKPPGYEESDKTIDVDLSDLVNRLNSK